MTRCLRIWVLRVILIYLLAQLMLNWDFGDAVWGRYPAVGMASWYTAVITSTGEYLEGDSLTCAMRRKDYGKYYRVCSQDNLKCVVVRHNNFGPSKFLYRHGRIIDLSHKAFLTLTNLETGIINVTVTEAQGKQ